MSVLLLALAYDLYAVGLVLMAMLLLFLDLGLLPYFVWYAFGWLYGVLRVQECFYIALKYSVKQ